MISYGVKADDADEIGLIWANKLLWNILSPLKRAKHIPLIVVGHSFGARVVTRAVFGNGLIDIPVGNETSNNVTEEECSIDLVVGLQGAFSCQEVYSGKWQRGSPYSEFNRNNYANKFVFTWSEYDFANPITKFFTGASHVGGCMDMNYLWIIKDI